MKKNQFPKGWNEQRVRRVLAHYEKQTEAEQIAEDERAFKQKERTVVEVPVELMPLIREIIALYKPTGT
jgi:hypothetical protein